MECFSEKRIINSTWCYNAVQRQKVASADFTSDQILGYLLSLQSSTALYLPARTSALANSFYNGRVRDWNTLPLEASPAAFKATLLQSSSAALRLPTQSPTAPPPPPHLAAQQHNSE